MRRSLHQHLAITAFVVGVNFGSARAVAHAVVADAGEVGVGGFGAIIESGSFQSRLNGSGGGLGLKPRD